MRALVIGTVEQYPTETAAWEAVETLRLDINYHTSRPKGSPETFEQLVKHYQMIELDLEKTSERKGYQTKQTYETYLRTRILPRWGEYRLRDIKAVAVERWLGSISDLSNSSKAKLKGIMSDVYQHAIPYGWLVDSENAILAVRQSQKRERVTEPLEATEFRALMLQLTDKMRVIGIIAATTGLRISEVLGLKWMDIDWKNLQMAVTRSVVAVWESAKQRLPVLQCPSTSSPPMSYWRGRKKAAIPNPMIGFSLARKPKEECLRGQIHFWIDFCSPPQSGRASANGLASTRFGTPTRLFSKQMGKT